jgi:hypothetical protein
VNIDPVGIIMDMRRYLVMEESKATSGAEQHVHQRGEQRCAVGFRTGSTHEMDGMRIESHEHFAFELSAP